MPDVNSILLVQANILDEELYQRSLAIPDFWADAVPRGEWTDGRGENPKAVTYEPTIPETETAWETVALNDGSGSTAVTTADDLKFASTTRAYMLARKALHTPIITLDDVRLSHEFKDQLDACFRTATQNTRRVWANRNRDEYVRLAQHKVVLNAALSESTGSFPASAATSRVTGQILKHYYRKLIDLGAASDGGAIEYENGKPLFTAVMGPELHDVIVKDDYQVREDFRNTSRANELLRGLGVDRAYEGFYHVCDFQAPRWNLTDGAWVSVPFWTTEATTKGNRMIPNPSYATATYEDTILYIPSVYTALVPKPLGKPGGNTEFDPKTYMGEWKWLNIPDMDTNPDMNWGRFRGLFYSASKPKNPDVGFVLRGLRPNIVTTRINANGDVVA